MGIEVVGDKAFEELGTVIGRLDPFDTGTASSCVSVTREQDSVILKLVFHALLDICQRLRVAMFVVGDGESTCAHSLKIIHEERHCLGPQVPKPVDSGADTNTVNTASKGGFKEVCVFWFVFVNDYLVSFVVRKKVCSSSFRNFPVAFKQGMNKDSGVSRPSKSHFIAIDGLEVFDHHPSFAVRKIPTVADLNGVAAIKDCL